MMSALNMIARHRWAKALNSNGKFSFLSFWSGLFASTVFIEALSSPVRSYGSLCPYQCLLSSFWWCRVLPSKTVTMASACTSKALSTMSHQTSRRCYNLVLCGARPALKFSSLWVSALVSWSLTQATTGGMRTSFGTDLLYRSLTLHSASSQAFLSLRLSVT